MQIIKRTEGGIEYLWGILRDRPKTITRVGLFKIPHKSEINHLSLKLGRYNKSDFNEDTLECDKPKSELTLDKEEFDGLISFISENYKPLFDGAKKYISIEDDFDSSDMERIKAIFKNPDKEKLLEFIATNNILPEDIIISLRNKEKANAIREFEEMLGQDLTEKNWQDWFQCNSWVLGTEFVKIIDDRHIDTGNIADYLVQAYDGFLDIVEIKKPDSSMKFWANTKDHDNYVPSTDLIKAITQATKYIYEVERESNSVKFSERVGIKTIKPRCSLIFGRSENWDDEQKEAYRILNSNYHNLTVMTYDHVLDRAKRILGFDMEKIEEIYHEDDINLPDDLFNEDENEIRIENIPF